MNGQFIQKLKCSFQLQIPAPIHICTGIPYPIIFGNVYSFSDFPLIEKIFYNSESNTIFLMLAWVS